MKFTALPVNVGDSFLLLSNNKYVLVDGGMNKSHIITLLNKEKIKNKHIHYLICTHYDADHINGLLGILQSGKYSFSELWLPEIFGSLTYTISCKIEPILKYWREHQYDLDKSIYDHSELVDEEYREDNISEYIDKEYKSDFKTNRYEDINLRVLNEFIKYSNQNLLYWPNYIPKFHIHPSSLNMKLNSSLIKICSFISSSIASGSHIRWFKYQDWNTKHKCPNSFIAENSIQTDITLYSPKIFLKMLYLTAINKESLVFRYNDPDNTNVLFTADSDLHFFKSPINLKKYSIVTAPHHGADTNNAAYAKISGKELIYIRSDRHQEDRPGEGYLMQAKRYCTVCKTNGPKQKISINYTYGTPPKIVGKSCICDTL